MKLLEIDSIIKSFGDRSVLSSVYLAMKQGTIVGLLGRNGSGKSTLLKIAFGIMPAPQKSVRIDGQYIPAAYRSGHIAYLAQENTIPQYLSVKQILSLIENDFIKRYQSFFECFLSNSNSKISDLSGGQERILNILFMLSRPSTFIFLDEPFTGLSPIVVEQMQDLFLQIKETKALLITDHLYRAVVSVADQSYYLDYGNLLPLDEHSRTLSDYGYIP